MKRTNKLFGAIFAMAFMPLAISCSTDDLEPGGGSTVAEEGDYYIKVAISGVPTNGSRAGTDATFDEGTPTENAISDLYFIFYDDRGAVVGDMAHLEFGDLTQETTLAGGSVNSTWSATVPVFIPKGQNPPTQVMCYINPITTANFAQPLNMLTSIRRDDFGIRNTVTSPTVKNFCMSNSVFYPEEQENSTPQVAAPISEKNLIKGPHISGDQVDDDKVVNIFVERYAAKVSVDATDMTIADYTPANPDNTNTFTLTFNDVKWIVNAVDKQTFSVKSFSEIENFGTPAATLFSYGTLNNTLSPAGSTWAWNSPTNKRSYWGCSTSYYSTAYPSVSSDYNDKNPDWDNYLLDYFSYNYIMASGNNTKVNGAHGTTYNYYKETTAGKYGLENAENPAASVASVVLIGTYTVNKNGAALTTQPSSFYTYMSKTSGEGATSVTKPLIYFGINDEGKCNVEGGTSVMSAMLTNSTILYLKEAATEEGSTPSYTQLEANNLTDQNVRMAFTVTRPTVEVLAGQKLPSRKVTLQLVSAEAAQNANIVVATNNGYLNIVDDPAEGTEVPDGSISLTEANHFIASAVQYADEYNGGRAYFNIPVQHYGWYRADNKNANADFTAKSVIEWEKVRPGDFGLVRNHSYTVKINNISGLGTAISDPNDPIIPPSETTEYHMHYLINVLNWALVPTQEVSL